MSGNNSISNNNARENGGGIHLCQSQLVIQGETSIWGNTAMFSGGGVHTTGLTISLLLGWSMLREKETSENSIEKKTEQSFACYQQ